MKARNFAGFVLAVAALMSLVACSDKSDDAATARPTTVVSTVTETETAERTAHETTTATSTVTQQPTGRQLIGKVDGADVRGFLSGPARCDKGDYARLIVHTVVEGKAGSNVVICQGDGLYYRGARDKAGDAGITVRDVIVTRGGYVATNLPYSYTVNHERLYIAKSSTLIQEELVVQFAYTE